MKIERSEDLKAPCRLAAVAAALFGLLLGATLSAAAFADTNTRQVADRSNSLTFKMLHVLLADPADAPILVSAPGAVLSFSTLYMANEACAPPLVCTTSRDSNSFFRTSLGYDSTAGNVSQDYQILTNMLREDGLTYHASLWLDRKRAALATDQSRELGRLGVSIVNIDFSKEGARDKLSSWIATHSDGILQNALSQYWLIEPQQTAAVLINTLSIKRDLQDPNQVEEKAGHVYAPFLGSAPPIPSAWAYEFYNDGKISGVRLHLVNNPLILTVFSTRGEDEIKQFAAGLDLKSWPQVLARFEKRAGYVNFSFGIRSQGYLRDVFPEPSAPTVFSAANQLGLVQKNMAAVVFDRAEFASTSVFRLDHPVCCVDLSEPSLLTPTFDFRTNRPMIYLLEDGHGMILFLGRWP